jgi:putative transposase
LSFARSSITYAAPQTWRTRLLDLYRSINVFIERLWRSLKYECVYLHAFETGSELRAGLARWIGHYNARRPHSTLAGRTPDEAYEVTETERLAA